MWGNTITIYEDLASRSNVKQTEKFSSLAAISSFLLAYIVVRPVGVEPMLAIVRNWRILDVSPG